MSLTSLSISADVRALTDLFLTTSIGDRVTFPQMSHAIGADIHARRYLAARAVHLASKEAGAIFGSVRKVGYQRLGAEDAHVVGAHARSRIRRTSRRAADKIIRAIGVANDLSDDARRKALAEVNSLQLIRHLSTDKSRDAAASDSDKPQPVAITMRAMLGQLGIVAAADADRAT